MPGLQVWLVLPVLVGGAGRGGPSEGEEGGGLSYGVRHRGCRCHYSTPLWCPFFCFQGGASPSVGGTLAGVPWEMAGAPRGKGGRAPYSKGLP